VIDLLILNGSRAGACLWLSDVPTVLGRSPEAHLRIDDPWISNMHALFELRGDDLWVVDLGSRNGTFVGPERVEEARVAVGTVLIFGRTEVRIEPHDAASDRLVAPARTPVHYETVSATIRTDRPAAVLEHSRLSASGLDPYRFALRPLALVRLSLGIPPGAASPKAETLHAALDLAARVARRHGGRATRLGSSASVAIFGFGGPAPDDAKRALQTARAVRDELHALTPGLSLRFGVDAGPALAGMVSGLDGSEIIAFGDAPDRVEQLALLAAPGEILVGPGVPLGADPGLEQAAERSPPSVGGLRRLRA
jgi:hypothetical protein